MKKALALVLVPRTLHAQVVVKEQKQRKRLWMCALSESHLTYAEVSTLQVSLAEVLIPQVSLTVGPAMVFRWCQFCKFPGQR